MITLLLFACGQPTQPVPEPTTTEPQPAQAIPDGSISIPTAISNNCMFGFDPHSRSIHVTEAQHYRIRTSPFSIYNWLGLQSGEEVLSINGNPLGTAQQWYDAREATEGQTSCTLEVSHHNKTRTVSFHLVNQGPAEPGSRLELAEKLLNPYTTAGADAFMSTRIGGSIHWRQYESDIAVALSSPSGELTLGDKTLTLTGAPLEVPERLLQALKHNRQRLEEHSKRSDITEPSSSDGLSRQERIDALRERSIERRKRRDDALKARNSETKGREGAQK